MDTATQKIAFSLPKSKGIKFCFLVPTSERALSSAVPQDCAVTAPQKISKHDL